ncbi:18918_t:CDS:1, partial [Racocetra fulgida]
VNNLKVNYNGYLIDLFDLSNLNNLKLPEKNELEEDKGDCRLRFYLNNSTDPLSKQDAIAITW